jgi:hypothetical protein
MPQDLGYAGGDHSNAEDEEEMRELRLGLATT